MNKTGSFRSHQTRDSNDQCIQWYSFMNFLLLFLHRSIQTVKCSLKSLNLCKFTAWCPYVLADKPHPRFDLKILSKKVRLICRCLWYIKCDNFQRFLTTFRRFPKIFQNCPKCQTNNISEHCSRRLKKIRRCFDHTPTNLGVVKGSKDHSSKNDIFT